MSFARPTLSELRSQVAADITSGLPTADGLLRFSNLQILGKAVAGLGHLNYGYLDWIAKQSVPYTASGEYLESWAALKKVYRKTARAGSGAVTFRGNPGVVLNAGTQVVRSDTATFTVQNSVVVNASGVVVVTVKADAAGEPGNTPIGSLMTLAVSVDGIQSSGAVSASITGGADQELDDALFERMLEAYQSTPNGGSNTDYPIWAKAVPGVTRAWCAPNGFGTGTVVVYVMFDEANIDYQGFPQGKDGISSRDNRVTSGNLAQGDQLTVANSIFDEQPVTAMIYLCSPIAKPQNFTISGLRNASTLVRDAVSAAICDVFREYGQPLSNGSVVALSDIDSAIAAISSTKGFVITSPMVNIANTAGYLPTLGVITYS